MPVPAERGVHARALLRDDVYRSIRGAIVRGELEPGEKINDAEIGAWLGVSRTPVREALLRLGRDGLVVARPGRVTTVAPEDPVALEHSRDVAAELHALATRVAAPLLDVADLAAMRGANERLRIALARGEVTDAIAADDDFHAVVVNRAGNPVLATHLDAVAATLRRAEYLHFGARTGPDSVEEHDHIIAFLDARDIDEAVRATRANWLGLRADHSESSAAPDSSVAMT